MNQQTATTLNPDPLSPIFDCPCRLQSVHKIASPKCKVCKGWGRYQLCLGCAGTGLPLGKSYACPDCQGKGKVAVKTTTALSH